MSKRRNWYTRAIHLMIALAFLLGLAIVPGTVTAQVPPPDPSLVPKFDLNVKGAIHKVCIDWTGWDPADISRAQIDWYLGAGVHLDPDDVIVISPTGQNPNVGGNISYGETIKTIGTIDNPYDCIEIMSMVEGDIHIFVKITLAGFPAWVLQAEKKWGELHHTILDVDASTEAVEHVKPPKNFDAAYQGIYQETLKDTVYGTFLEYGEELADGAIVHWWLVEDTDANQDWVDDFMDYLAAHNGTLDDDHWAAHGKYKASELGGKQPWEYINDWVCGPDNTPGTDDDRAVDPNLFYWSSVDVPGEINTHPDTEDWYAWAVTNDGIAKATLSVDVENLISCQTYKVMIVVLVSYPSGSTPQDDPHNGEQPVCLEKGKKEFHKGKPPVITQVKTPQLRWAGEKIVLEKDWGVYPYLAYNYTYYMDGYTSSNLTIHTYAAYYTLQEGAIGALEPVSDVSGWTVEMYLNGVFAGVTYVDMEYFGLPLGAQAVLAPLGGRYLTVYMSDMGGSFEASLGEGWSDTQAILWSQTDGEADVNAALYEVTLHIEWINIPGYYASLEEFDMNGPIADHGFLVYFLEFEDVTLSDITPPSDILGLDPGDDAEVAVQVRGFFDYRHSSLMATTREAKVIDVPDSDVDVVLPAGRYILPDDWGLIAGTTDVSLRPNFDLMDQAHLMTDGITPDPITSLNELGPYDEDVVTTEDPGEAEYPTIGPFSTYQQWSIEDMWVAAATVPSSFPLPDGGSRNTVVPDGEINKWDAPMPQALVIFDVVSDTGTVSGLDKGNLKNYGFKMSEGVKVYQSPFYSVEIPANWQIPPGYNWMSWTRDPSWLYWYIPNQGPYDFWTDLQLKSIISNTSEAPIDRSDVEVYSDNHGIAGVCIDALGDEGYVTITATADYPYIPKRGKYGPKVSDGITATWGAAPLPEPNPWFTADKTEVEVGETVTFTNETVGGKEPYVAAEWDFNDDGVPDSTLAVQRGETVSFPYPNPGIFNVSLKITDGNDVTRKETRYYYITVAGEAYTTWNCPLGSAPLIAPNPGAGRPALTVAAACDGITASGGEELWGIYYLVETGPDAGTYLWYIPGFATSTLTQLEPGELYYVVVSGPCTLTIPQ